MKIQCDVCSKNHASFFCTADEAALCDGCDHRVHHANKLASKHQRFSLNHPSANHFPLCDVCQERRAFVFCQQDRAILCKECDLPIHSVNDLTKNHSRFLLTGIKLSAAATATATAALHPSPTPSNSCNALQPPLLVAGPPTMNNNNNKVAGGTVGGSLVGANEEGGGFTSSSISEYLIKTIPGWQVDDFLDSPSVPFAFSKNGDDDALQLFDAADIEGNLGSFSAKSMGGIWVPQAPSSTLFMGQQNENKEATGTKGSSRSRLGDDNFIVPQMSPASNIASSKRARLLW